MKVTKFFILFYAIFIMILIVFDTGTIGVSAFYDIPQVGGGFISQSWNTAKIIVSVVYDILFFTIEGQNFVNIILISFRVIVLFELVKWIKEQLPSIFGFFNW